MRFSLGVKGKAGIWCCLYVLYAVLLTLTASGRLSWMKSECQNQYYAVGHCGNGLDVNHLESVVSKMHWWIRQFVMKLLFWCLCKTVWTHLIQNDCMFHWSFLLQLLSKRVNESALAVIYVVRVAHLGLQSWGTGVLNNHFLGNLHQLCTNTLKDYSGMKMDHPA